jgi:hypothetical protein
MPMTNRCRGARAVQQVKKEAEQKVFRLCGTVIEDEQGFTHFVCLSKNSGGSGFQKSFPALWALASGMQSPSKHGILLCMMHRTGADMLA